MGRMKFSKHVKREMNPTRKRVKPTNKKRFNALNITDVLPGIFFLIWEFIIILYILC